MNQFRKIRKSVRQQAVAEGILRRVAKETGFTVATVSRTFAGRFDTPNKDIAAALNRAMEDMGISNESAA